MKLSVRFYCVGWTWRSINNTATEKKMKQLRLLPEFFHWKRAVIVLQ